MHVTSKSINKTIDNYAKMSAFRRCMIEGQGKDQEGHYFLLFLFFAKSLISLVLFHGFRCNMHQSKPEAHSINFKFTKNSAYILVI